MSFDDMMQTLRKEYIAGIPSKIISIQTACAASDLNLLREEFHKLKGTGKTYGLPEVSELCAVIEDLCVSNSPHAINDAKIAAQLLSDIHQVRVKDQSFNLLADTRFTEFQKHLQSTGT